MRSDLGDRLASAGACDDEIWGGMPAVGDWVVVCDAPGDRFAIEALLPAARRCPRKTPWLKAEEHILVANVDKVLLVAGLDGDFNPRRLERYLTAAWDSAPIRSSCSRSSTSVTMTGSSPRPRWSRLVPVLAVSNVTARDRGRPGAARAAKTFVLLGSSGTGKSTLVNRLAGREVMETGGLRKETAVAATRRGIASCSSCPTARS